MPLALLLVGIPLAFGVAAFLTRSDRVRPWLVPAGGCAHLLCFAFAAGAPEVTALDGWLKLDALGKLVLGFVSLLFTGCAWYAPAYLRLHPDRPHRIFCAALLGFLAMMSLVLLAHHMGLMWVAIEATTLTSAPLLYFHRTPRSLEAVWKYLLIGSVGIALALFGSFFLAYASLHAGHESTLLFDDLIREGPGLSKPWLHAAFVLLFVGYGTKMGLAPMHTWKPDAYGEAPGLVGALLAGGLTNCAFVALLRFFQIVQAAGDGAFARQIFVTMGLFSMALAAVFMVRQRDYKRMLAYSSVEHMGILVLGIGLGGLGVFGALLHLLNNGLTKGVLFLSAGNIHRAYGAKVTDRVSGALRRLPVSGALFLAGFFAITGSPPFGPFFSELTILQAAVGDGRYGVAGLFLGLLAIIFIGMGATVLAVVQGDPPAEAAATPYRDTFGTCAAPVVFLVGVLCLGCWLPAPIEAWLRAAAAFVEGRP